MRGVSLEQGADLLLTVKSNQKTLYRQIGHQFQGKRKIPFVAKDHEISHGRDIVWTLRAKQAPEIIREAWIGTSWIVELMATGTRDGKTFHATHLFLTCLHTTSEALLQLAPTGELAEKIKGQQRRLADRVMRANAQGLPRMDAVMYLSSALEAYRSLDTEGQKQLLAEVAAVGQKGLAINNPDQKHQLRLYQGGATVSALQVACILYVGVQLLLPGQDAGMDFAREYALAKGMTGGG
jgi:hypothetical protein